jgi:hypothetical protein
MVPYFYSITIFIYGQFASEGLIFLYHSFALPLKGW